MTDTTRIMDLPEAITMQQTPIQNQMQHSGPPPPIHQNQNQNQNQNGQAFGGNSYTPIDVHPNPYGHPPPSVPNIPKPSENFKPGMLPPPTHPPIQQTLPSRDIPMDQDHLTQDEQTQPNYIPPIPDSAKKTSEYVKQYEEATEKMIQKHAEEKAKQSRFDSMVEEGQIPILIAVLFFLFHMPMVDTFIFKHMSFLALHTIDGHFNMYGLFFKSILFAGCFFWMTQMIQWLSEV